MSPTPKSRKLSSPVHRSKSVKTSRGLIRVVAGEHRGRRLPVLMHEGLRPTSDRVKETLFNWLMSSVSHANCLDMYAGSGSLGIEALSRGATAALFIEQDKTVAQQISTNIVTLRETNNAIVVNANALTLDFSTLPGPPFDLVFVDPPFGHDMLAKSIEKLLSDKLLSPNAFIYIETGHADQYPVPAAFILMREMKTSQVDARLYQFKPLA